MDVDLDAPSTKFADFGPCNKRFDCNATYFTRTRCRNLYLIDSNRLWCFPGDPVRQKPFSGKFGETLQVPGMLIRSR